MSPPVFFFCRSRGKERQELREGLGVLPSVGKFQRSFQQRDAEKRAHADPHAILKRPDLRFVAVCPEVLFFLAGEGEGDKKDTPVPDGGDPGDSSGRASNGVEEGYQPIERKREKAPGGGGKTQGATEERHSCGLECVAVVEGLCKIRAL